MQDTTTAKFMHSKDQGRQHIRNAVLQTIEGFDDTDSSAFSKPTPALSQPTISYSQWIVIPQGIALIAQAPKNTWSTGNASVHMVHWQCIRPQLHDSLQAAHTLIATEFYSLLPQHVGKNGWEPLMETPIAKAPFYTSTRYKKWQVPARLCHRRRERLQASRCPLPPFRPDLRQQTCTTL